MTRFYVVFSKFYGEHFKSLVVNKINADKNLFKLILSRTIIEI